MTDVKNINSEKSKLFKPLYLRETLFCILYGGRSGGKSWEIADYLLIAGTKRTERILCCREVQKSLRQSVHQLLKDRIKFWNLGGFYEVLNNEIRGKNGTLIQYTGLQEHTADSIKSFEGATITWVEEGQSVSATSLDILVPTVTRTPNCQIIISMNPYLPSDAVWADYIEPAKNGERDDVTLIEVNYTDNKHCPPEIIRLAEQMKAKNHDKWLNIYGGQPKLIADGAIYHDELTKLKEEGRLTAVPVDPALPVHTVWDLGISDSTSIWFVQVYGKEPRLVDFYESNGEGLAHYARKLTEKGYNYGKHFAPHDIKVRELGSGVSRLETARKLGINFEVVKQMSVADGIDAVRQLLGVCWIDEKRCEHGVKCLRNYRREYDDKMKEFKATPVHDWASHASDALRYVAIAVKTMMPKPKTKPKRRQKRQTSWMG